MRSDLDRKFDETLSAVTGPGGRIVIARDDQGLAFVADFPGTLPGLFKAFCALHAPTVALITGEERVTFGELDRLSDRLARSLAGRGIAKGDRVGIAMRNSAAWVVAYMAILKAGGVATLLNGWWQAHEMAHALALSEPALVIADAARFARIAAPIANLDIVMLDIDRGVEQAIEPLLGDEADLPEIGPHDDATILFTSGSTGAAKGAVSTHRAVTTGVYTYATGLITLLSILESEGSPPQNPPRTLLTVPLFHVTGEVPVLLNSFVIGRGIVLMPKWDALEALRLIEKEKVTYFVGVPTMSLELMTHPDRDKYDLTSMTDIAAGGAPRPVSHVARLQQAFDWAKPAIGYGLTETNAVGCGNFWTNYAAKPASTGRAQRPFVDLAILGSGDRHLEPNEIGEVAIRTVANFKGYWRDAQATRAAFTDDLYVRTGDIGYLDEDGYLFIVDRKKDIIIRGGENISAAEVEAACYACLDVAEAAVFGAPDERLGEVPIAVIHPSGELTEDQLRSFLQSTIAAFKVPARFIFTAEPLPRLGTGKIDRVALKALYAH